MNVSAPSVHAVFCSEREDIAKFSVDVLKLRKRGHCDAPNRKMKGSRRFDARKAVCVAVAKRTRVSVRTGRWWWCACRIVGM